MVFWLQRSRLISQAEWIGKSALAMNIQMLQRSRLITQAECQVETFKGTSAPAASTEPPDFSGGMFAQLPIQQHPDFASTEPPDFSGGMAIIRTRSIVDRAGFNGAA